MVILTLLSILYAQEEREVRGISQEAKGIECSFTEPFLTLRYDFTTKILSSISFDVPENSVSMSLVDLKRKESKNPFVPTYQMIPKNETEPIVTLYLNNNGSDGMSGIFYPIDAHMPSVYGGCLFVDAFGTHVVYGTAMDEEPWLNIRSKGSIKGKIIGKIQDGVEVNIIKTQNRWYKIEVISSRLKGIKGWVSSIYLKERK